ncbi:nucleolar and spindle-associated protein 1 [Aulostomus maculatus]
MELDSMKYAELRSLAKQLGLKANMKADKLLKAIKQHYQQGKDGEQGQEEEACVAVVREWKSADECNVEDTQATVFVNTRRGKGDASKRRIFEVATEGDAKLQPSVDEDEDEVDAPKKHRVSSPRGAETSEKQSPPKPVTTSRQQQQGIKDGTPVQLDTGNAPNVAKAGKIPRLKGLQKKQSLKTVTPNFKKLHEAHFNKMESIDSYVQRKTKHMETLRNSVKKLKNGKRSHTSMFSPVLENKSAAEDKRRATLLSAGKAQRNKPAEKEDAPFRPSVLSTRRINVRFSEVTHNNEFKKSLVKTPARMSLCVASSTPQKQTGNGNNMKTSTSSTTKTPGPYIFTGYTSVTPGTQKKTSFDLKASLSRPLNYKPHTGKLKPFGEAKENTAGNKSLTSNSHQKNYKQHKVQTREDRRAKHTDARKQKKESMLGARRGLVMM